MMEAKTFGEVYAVHKTKEIRAELAERGRDPTTNFFPTAMDVSVTLFAFQDWLKKMQAIEQDKKAEADAADAADKAEGWP
jgi:hypothetical protein